MPTSYWNNRSNEITLIYITGSLELQVTKTLGCQYLIVFLFSFIPDSIDSFLYKWIEMKRLRLKKEKKNQT